MQKKLFLILSGLLLLTAQAYGQELRPAAAPAMAPSPSVAGGWSAPIYHPEIGDKIVKVNNRNIHSEAEFRRAIANSPRTIILGVIDQRTGNYYHLRTNLWSPNNQTRLGIYIRTARNYDGVIVTGFVPNCPGMHCQYMRGETRPVYDGLSTGGWYYDDDDDYYEDDDDDDWYY